MKHTDVGAKGERQPQSNSLVFTRRRAMRGIVKVLVIGVLGLAGLLVPAGYVHALDNYESCRKQGYALCEDGKCGNRSCYCNNKVLKPGEDCTKTLGGKHYMFICNGCSGKMEPVALRTPQQTPAKPPAGGTLQRKP
jgi:hypothetical protein